MAEACSQPNPDCKYFDTPECLVTRHHNYFPSTDYQTPVERAFRNLPHNSTMMQRCDHDEFHATNEPPEKPPLQEMARVVLSSEGYISRRLKKELRKDLNGK
jgi:hypothetical protein